MSTNPHELNGRDFAHQCMNALSTIKQSLPQSWQQRLAPYKKEIMEYALTNKVTNTTALQKLLENTNNRPNDVQITRVENILLRAAFCDMV